MDISRIYYEKWLGKDNCLIDKENLQFIYSEERNQVQLGYSERFDLYVWIGLNRSVVSYGDATSQKLEALKERLSTNQNISEITTLLTEIYECEVKHQIKYAFEKVPEIISNQPKTLLATDYQDYEVFFRTCQPNVTDISWLLEYFEEMIAEGLCVGIYEDGKIVCCTDAPMMPYLADQTQEIGVNTLPAYRQKGYAASACRQVVANILENNKVPIWSTTGNNQGSQKLAERVGFKKLADVLTITVKEV